MSDEEDTTILLSGKNSGRGLCEPSMSVQHQTLSKDSQNVVCVNSRNHAVVATFVGILGGIAFGYDMGFSLNVFTQVKQFYSLTCMEQYMIRSVWLIGALFASAVGGIVIDGCGRRWTICCTAILLVLGLAISAAGNSYPLLLCGRLVSGFGGSLSAVAQCIYAAELSDAHVRGRSVSVHQLGAAMGFLLACVAGAADNIDWKMLVWLGTIPVIIEGLLAAFFLPRSPHFTLLQMSQTTQIKRPSVWCAAGNLVETFVLALGLVFFQQFSGLYSVLTYAPRLFVLLGVCPDIAPSVANITFGIIKVCATFLSLCAVDRVGRRPSLIVSATCMMTSIALLGVFSAVEESEIVLLLDTKLEPCGVIESGGSLVPSPEDISSQLLPAGTPPYPYLPTPVSLIARDSWSDLNPCSEVSSVLSPGLRYLAMFTLLCYESAFAFGLGPVVWLLLAELFPAAARGRAVALTMCLHWLADFIIPATFVGFLDVFSLGGSFLFFSMICLFCISFVFLFVPETKGKSLHQIAQELKNVSPKTRMFQNLQGLPCLSKSEWLLHKARQYRQVSHSGVESTVI
ncbi:solute carrier family 2, facilitated glucose transporter member 10 [Anabrus simplex]|uniref:solute carrier family 2, facilitated glucose transporter member 10 n=1 Tax=Anabrus simplex TaxID=316456 RepID=UPI0034DD3894